MEQPEEILKEYLNEIDLTIKIGKDSIEYDNKFSNTVKLKFDPKIEKFEKIAKQAIFRHFCLNEEDKIIALIIEAQNCFLNFIELATRTDLEFKRNYSEVMKETLVLN